MSRNLLSVEDDRPVYEAIRLFQEHHVGQLLVTNNGSPTESLREPACCARFSTL